MVNNTIWQKLYADSQVNQQVASPIAPQSINDVLSQFATAHLGQSPWYSSPSKGVMRKLIERQGGEKTTRATSIVSFAPNSHFSAHNHPLGEEFLVLAGTFSDENGHYPAGSYVRNPPGSSHTPYSDEGCLIFVKLQQFSPQDNEQVALTKLFTPPRNKRLFDNYERVELLHLDQELTKEIKNSSTATEILVLNGSFNLADTQYFAGDWLRIPKASGTIVLQATMPTLVYVKQY